MPQPPLSLGIIFLDDLTAIATQSKAEHILHLFCTQGSVRFNFQGQALELKAQQYAIFPVAPLFLHPQPSSDFKAQMFLLSTQCIHQLPLNSTYGSSGHIALMQNPIIKLNAQQCALLFAEVTYLRARLAQTEHCFYAELILHLLCAHILDLYDIHATAHPNAHVSGKAQTILSRFIALLEQGLATTEHQPAYYAARLCISTHYLSEICRRLTGKPCRYWIDRYLLQAAVKLLCRPELNLSTIAATLNFYDSAHFARFFRAQTGLSPKSYRHTKLN